MAVCGICPPLPVSQLRCGVYRCVGALAARFFPRFLRHVVDDSILPLRAFKTAASRHRSRHCLSGRSLNAPVVVAVITQVCADKVRIRSRTSSTAKSAARVSNGPASCRCMSKTVSYNLSDTFPDTQILGWMIQTIDDLYARQEPAVDPALMTLHAARLDERSRFHR